MDHTTSLSGVTSKISWSSESPIKVLPLRNRSQHAAAALLATVALAAVGAGLWYSGDRPSAVEERPGVLDDRPGDVADRPQPMSAKPADTSGETASESAARTAVQTAAKPTPTRQLPTAKSLADQARAESSAVQPAASEPPPEASAPGAPTALPASDAEVAASPVLPSEAVPPAKSAIGRARTRSAETRPSALDAHKAQSAASSKQAPAAQRSTERLAREQAISERRSAQSRATTAKEMKEAKEIKEAKEAKERVYAPWASLEPPAWALSTYRGKGPGVPPGAMPYEARTNVASAATPAAASPTITTSAPRDEPGGASAQPALTAPITSSATLPSTPPANSNSQVPSTPLANFSLQSPAPPLMQSSAPIAAPPPVPTSPPVQEDYAALGRQALQTAVPRIAARAELQVARVLGMAASAYTLNEERAVAEASRAARVADVDLLPLQRPASVAEARRFNDEARAALRLHRDIREAIELELRAFGANPRDPEVTGTLASLYLRITPGQPEMARQLALVALTARAPQYHSARMEDWTTFAIASALTGREADARNALYVTLALTADVDARCVATLNAVATYGDRMRKPVEAMFYRLHTQGRAVGSQPCAWPPNSSLASRVQ